MDMLTNDDKNQMVHKRKLELLMQTPVGRRIIRSEIISSYTNVGYSYADAAILFDLIDQGMIKNVCIGEKNV